MCSVVSLLCSPMFRKERTARGFVQFVGTGWLVTAAAEFAALGALYYYYRRLNQSQESRYWLYQNYKPCLEVYYKVSDAVSTNAMRTYDYKTWGVEE